MYPSQTAPERYADAIVHAVSLVGLMIAGGFLIGMATAADNFSLIVSTVIYVFAILASVSISFAYHLLPHHHLRKRLQRWDHAAIYTLIAGTLSPLLIIAGTTSATIILAIIWLFAIAGVLFKTFAQNIEAKWSLASYLGLGWFGLVAMPDLWTALPAAALIGIVAGGVFYTIGTLFYKSKGLRFRYPIWHAFGLIGGSCFFAANWISVAG